MSAPPGRARTSNLGRVSTKGPGRGRDNRNGTNTTSLVRQSARSSATSLGTGSQRLLKPSTKQQRGANGPSERSRKHSSSARTTTTKASLSEDEAWRNATIASSSSYKQHMSDLYQKLKLLRDQERKQAIRDGILADPDKPTSLANAITPVGTCRDMCPEFERVERIVQQMVDGCEKETAESGARVPCEDIMVKRFRRSAAGYDEQLPSDIRPPVVLKQSLDYLINDIVGGPEPLSSVHKFVWDRTRGIRNDFSIQQVTRTEDLRLAIECFERIARFHILALHQLSRNDLRDNEFDHYQEREQLNNTLLSLIYYYDDSRHKFSSPHEAEFRSYCIIFEIQTMRPDLEDRVQNWPDSVLRDRRVQTALKLYAAAGSSSYEQGPLAPKARFSSAQGDASGFWKLLKSNAVSYLTACVAEIYFNFVRSFAMEIIWKAYKVKRGGSSNVEDWTVKDLCSILGFDDEDQTARFCEEYGFVVGSNASGDLSVNLSSQVGTSISDSNPRRKQLYSRTIVERKRLGRSLSAVIDGISAANARAQGMLEESSDVEDASESNDENLFLDENSDVEHKISTARSPSPTQQEDQKPNSTIESTAGGFKAGSMFGKPTVVPNPFQAQVNGSENDTQPSLLKNGAALQPTFNPFASKDFAKANPFGHTNESGPKSVAEPPISLPTDRPPSVSTTSSSPSFQFPSTTLNSEVKRTHGASPIFPAASFSSPDKDNSLATSSRNEANQSPFSMFKNLPSPQQRDATGAPASEPTKPPDKTTSSTSSQNWSSFERRLPPFSFGSQTALQPNGENVNASSLPLQNQQRETEPVSTSSPLNVPQPSKRTPSTSASPSSASFSFPLPFPGILPTTLPAALSAPSPLISSSLTNSNDRREEGPHANSFAQQQSAPASPSTFQESTHQRSDDSMDQTPRKDTRQIAQSIKISPQKLRSNALDEVSRIIMTEAGGFLEQFIEFTLTPLIRSSIFEFQDQKSWAVARKCRASILSKKYFARWKSNAWKLGLKRAARERRKNLSQSLKESVHRPVLDSEHFSKESSTPNAVVLASVSGGEPQQSPVKQVLNEGRSLLASMSLGGTKRKRESSESRMKVDEPQRLWQKHKRSNTLATSVMPASPSSNVHSRLRGDLVSTRAGDGSLLGDTLMRQARRLAPEMKSDTTRTDYFALKARGIDPNTPIVPRTKKRPRSTDDIQNQVGSRNEGSGRAVNLSNGCAVAKRDPADDDEALFASIKSLRNTLAESTTWFQHERQSLERSVTPQHKATPSKDETPAERRLRELKERGRTPTRSEIRHRSTAHFQSGFSSHLGQHGEHFDLQDNDNLEEVPQPSARPSKMGFAALNQSIKINGYKHEDLGPRGGDDVSMPQKGQSAEDAIEL